MNDIHPTTTENAEAVNRGNWRTRACLLVILSVGAFEFTGCVATGVGVGYDGYYAPSYADYYGDYGYGGVPYWGGGPYVGSTIVIGGRSHRGYYGGHHFAGDFRSGRGGGMSRGGFSRGGLSRGGGSVRH
jgi:hypothetical protein